MSQVIYARLKPYAPEYGCVKKRFHVGGRLFVGGTGQPGDVPIWYRINPAQAEFLRRFKQNDNDYRSPLAFDIVHGEAERQAIDEQEEMERKMALGLIPKPQRRLATARTSDISKREKGGPAKLEDMATGRRAALDDLEEPAPLVDDAVQEVDGHEEINTDVSSRDIMDNADIKAEMNAEARAAVPDMSTVEAVGEDATPAEVAPEANIQDGGLPPVAALPPLDKSGGKKRAKTTKKAKKTRGKK